MTSKRKDKLTHSTAVRSVPSEVTATLLVKRNVTKLASLIKVWIQGSGQNEISMTIHRTVMWKKKAAFLLHFSRVFSLYTIFCGVHEDDIIQRIDIITVLYSSYRLRVQ
jgi:hypothetical protein